MNKQLLDLFKLKLKKPQITQRDLASQLNISLGKVNQLLDQLKQNGFFNEKLSLTIKGKEYIKNGVIDMPVSYEKLFKMMEQRGIKKVDLRKNGFSPTIVDRLVKNSDVNVSTIIKLCEVLQCQPGDIMAYVDDKGFTRMIPTSEGAKRLQEIQDRPKKKQEIDKT